MIVIAAERGSYAGKPRPWLIVQNDAFLDDPASITVCAISSDEPNSSFRVVVSPTPENGLTHLSNVLIDKIVTIRASAIDKIAGQIGAASMKRVDSELRLWLDL